MLGFLTISLIFDELLIFVGIFELCRSDLAHLFDRRLELERRVSVDA